FVAAVDFSRDRTYVRHMQQEAGDGWWDDDCPLPDLPPVDLPDDPDPEPEDDLNEMLRAAKMRNGADGQIALRILHLLRTTTPIGGGSARDLVGAEIGPPLRPGSG